MWNFNKLTRLEYKEDYRYFVGFDDGVACVLDLSGYLELGPVFETLRDPVEFKRARIEGNTIAWPNGADIAPETLYRHCLQQQAKQRNY